MKPLFYTLLLAGLVAPWATQAGPRMMTPLQVECVRGVVMVRSITTMVQLNSPETGKPMTCKEKSAQVRQLEHTVEVTGLQLDTAEQAASALQVENDILKASVAVKDELLDTLLEGPIAP